MNIDELLLKPGQQDKSENFSTTSLLFKRNVWEFFYDLKLSTCVEFGTHKGQTTNIMSYLFEKVYTVNLPNHMDSAKEFNKDRTNIEFVEFDLYSNAELKIPGPIDVFFVDANHEYEYVMRDVERIQRMNHSESTYIIFDDYGGQIGVNIAVHDLVENEELQIVKYIGYPAPHSFGGTPERILKDWEGVICKLLK